MRRHLTIIPLILWAFCGFAQNFSPLSESSEGIFPPQGWTNLHVSGTPQWSQTNTLEYCAGAQEGANYVMVGFGQNDNYLITPKLYPQIGDSIVFYMGIESPNYNIDNFTTVEVSTTGTAPADFTTVRNLTVADFTMGDNWYRFAVNLGGYAGQGIYVAFHNKVTASGMLAGGNVYLDNVSGPDMAVNTDIHLLRVRFLAKPYENIASYGRMEIGLLPDINDTANFEIVSTIEAVNLPSTDYVQYTVPFLGTTLSGNNRLVCFRCIGQAGSIW